MEARENLPLLSPSTWKLKLNLILGIVERRNRSEAEGRKDEDLPSIV